MSFFKSIKSAFGGSDSDEYDVFGQPTTFVNPFSKDKNVPDHEHDHEKGELHIEVNQQEEYAIDAEFADKAARLMNEHTQAVIDMLKGCPTDPVSRTPPRPPGILPQSGQ